MEEIADSQDDWIKQVIVDSAKRMMSAVPDNPALGASRVKRYETTKLDKLCARTSNGPNTAAHFTLIALYQLLSVGEFSFDFLESTKKNEPNLTSFHAELGSWLTENSLAAIPKAKIKEVIEGKLVQFRKRSNKNFETWTRQLLWRSCFDLKTPKDLNLSWNAEAKAYKLTQEAHRRDQTTVTHIEGVKPPIESVQFGDQQRLLKFWRRRALARILSRFVFDAVTQKKMDVRELLENDFKLKHWDIHSFEVGFFNPISLEELLKIGEDHSVFVTGGCTAILTLVDQEQNKTKLIRGIISNCSNTQNGLHLKKHLELVLNPNELKIKIEKIRDNFKSEIENDNNDWQSKLKELYQTLSLSSSQFDLELYADHFLDPSWIELILRSQDLKKEKEKSHLHTANEIISSVIADHFGSHWENQNEVSVRVIEGGVGGVNTTHKVMEGLERAASVAGCDINEILYRGFELSPDYAYLGNGLISGENIVFFEKRLKNQQKDDPRADYFQKLRDILFEFPKQLGNLPVPVFVDAIDMAEGINYCMDRPGMKGSIDVVVASYVLHHIPNSKHICSELEDMKHITDDWLSSVTQSVRQKSEAGHFPSAGIASADQLAATIRVDDDHRLEDVLQVLESKGNLAANLDSLVPWIRDSQIAMLKQIRDLLKPGGLLVIADPDGLSLFNRKMVFKTAEMAIANFRGFQELRDILADIGDFQEIGVWRQMKDAGGRLHTIPVMGDIEIDLDLDQIIDAHLGYIVVAKKN